MKAIRKIYNQFLAFLEIAEWPTQSDDLPNWEV